MIKQLFAGLERFGGSRDASDYAYAGGKGDVAAMNKLRLTGLEAPPIAMECMCGHSIVKQCYIQAKGKPEIGLAVVGSCCIKRFIPTGLDLTCERCHDPHKNRKNNLCNMCREEDKTQLETERKKKERELDLKWARRNQVFIRVPFANKEWAKEKGARWDADERMWYCSKDNAPILALYPPIRSRAQPE